MSTFQVKVVEVTIEPHDNADTLEIANIKGYQCIVRKGQYKTGDTAIYIPEQALVPKWILKEMNLWDDEKDVGKLAGSKGDRVKALKLRGRLSQGLLFPNIHNLPVGVDVSEELGITKWEPPIPVQMAGQVANVHGYTLKYDIENIKNYPEVVDFLIENEISVEITEKIHGTWACFGFYVEEIHPEVGHVVITSKGLSAKGLAFKDVPENNDNLYVRTFREVFNSADVSSGIMEALVEIFRENDDLNYDDPIFFLGEIFGRGVQDLTYGFNDLQFRLFDVFIGTPREGRYLTPFEMNKIRSVFPKLSRVPVLYRGPLTREIIAEYTDGMDSLNGHNIREGIVIKPYIKGDLNFPELGRVILKSVSEAYLTRKNGTEFN